MLNYLKDWTNGMIKSEIIRDIEKGLSHDTIVGRHANRWLSNVELIKNIIKSYKWEQWRLHGRKL